MKRFLLRLCLLGTIAARLSTASGTETPDAGDAQAQTEYDQAVAAYDAALAQFRADYAQLKTEAERTKLVAAEYPQPAQFEPRFLVLAQKRPDTQAAIKALTWIVIRDANWNFDGVSPLDLLHTRYLKSDQLALVCRSLTYSNPGVEPFLQDVLAANPSRGVRAAACLSLGKIARRDGDAAGATKFFHRAADEFADVSIYQDQTVGEQAGNALFEMTHLAVGNPAPEITGTDAHGQEFKLSDHRGKVVVIDFWGRW